MNSTFKNVWRCFYPLLIYIGVQQIVIGIIMPLIIAQQYLASGGLYDDIEALTAYAQTYATQNAVLYTAISAAVASIPLIILMRLDYKKSNKVFNPRQVSAWKYGLVVAGAITLSLGLSFITTLFSLAQRVESYGNVTEQLYSGNIWIQLIGIGIVVPIVEEVVFRGLIYNRCKQVFGSAIISMVTTSIMFGVFHQNIVQSICAMVASFYICMVYEKFGNFVAPVLFHICFNLPSVILTYFSFNIENYMTIIYMAVALIIVAILVAWMIIRLLPWPFYKRQQTSKM